MATIEIETTKHEKEFTVINIPIFLRSKDKSEWIAILDENTFVSIFNTQSLTIVQNGAISEFTKTTIAKAWRSWHSCTESEFLEKYDQVIESISLHPILVR